MYDGGEYIYSVLTGDAAIAAIVGTSIHNGRRLPDDAPRSAINFYRLGPFNGGIEYFRVLWSISCWGDTQADADDLAWLVHDALNREFVTVGDYQYYGSGALLPSIPPVNETDSWNTPVELFIRRK